MPFSDEEYAEDTEPIFLCSSSDDIQAGMIMAALQDKRIPAMMKTEGAGQYLSVYMGSSYYEKDIYVPSRLYAEACDVLAGIMGPGADEPPLSDEPTGDADDLDLQSAAHTRHVKGWIILAVFLGIPVLFVLYILIRILFG